MVELPLSRNVQECVVALEGRVLSIDSTRLRWPIVCTYVIGDRNAHLYTRARIFGTTIACSKPKFELRMSLHTLRLL
jgi:hypothetical protein